MNNELRREPLNTIQYNTIQYNTIDLCKFILSFCVIALHTEPFSGSNTRSLWFQVVDRFVNLAVPFFFLASGFFAGQKLLPSHNNEEKMAIIKSLIQRFALLYLCWSLIYLPLAIIDNINRKVPAIKAIVSYLRGLVLIGENYNSWMLWFLLSEIYALFFVLFCFKRNFSTRIIFCFACFFLWLSLSLDAFANFEITEPFSLVFVQKALRISLASGRIFRGFFYIPCGLLLAENKLSKRLTTSGAILFFASACLCPYWNIKQFFTAICAFCFFSTISQIQLKNSSIYPTLRHMSTTIYFIHLYVWTGYYMLMYGTKTTGLHSFFATSTISLILAYFYKRIKEES